MSDEHWIDTTAVGSAYEQQFDITSIDRWRHRPLKMTVDRSDFGEERGYGEWRPGAAPDLNLA